MKKAFLFFLLASPTVFFAGNTSSGNTKDYYAEAEKLTTAQEASEREAKILALAAALAAEEARKVELARKRRREQLQSMGRALGYSLRSAYLLVTGQAKGIGETATGITTVAAITTASYYSYKHWSIVKLFANPKHLLVGACALSLLSYKINKR